MNSYKPVLFGHTPTSLKILFCIKHCWLWTGVANKKRKNTKLLIELLITVILEPIPVWTLYRRCIPLFLRWIKSLIKTNTIDFPRFKDPVTIRFLTIHCFFCEQGLNICFFIPLFFSVTIIFILYKAVIMAHFPL